MQYIIVVLLLIILVLQILQLYYKNATNIEIHVKNAPCDIQHAGYETIKNVQKTVNDKSLKIDELDPVVLLKNAPKASGFGSTYNE